MGPYKKEYGAWAGDPKGRKPDLSRCCEVVRSKERWSRGTQCARKRGFGPDNAYCKQHDPQAAAERKQASMDRFNADWNRRRYEIHGRQFFDALQKIADGHNDARGLAQEVISEFKKGERT